MKVLLVDDSPVMIERLEELLASILHVEIVGKVRTPSEAVQATERLAPDLVILDIRLSGGSGIDALRAIKSMQYPPTIIMLTNYPYPEYRDRCMELGTDFFFEKSGDMDPLYEVIQQLSAEQKN